MASKRGAVALVLSPSKAVINLGKSEGVQLGSKYLVYATGPEVTDPVTGDSLGQLELVKGFGLVTHVQENMATLSAEVSAGFATVGRGDLIRKVS